MNKREKAELFAKLNNLVTNKMGILGKIQATNSLSEGAELEDELVKVNNEIADINLKLENGKAENENTVVKANNYIESNRAVIDFVDTLAKNAGKSSKDFTASWENMLSKNGLTIEDDSLFLPKKLVEPIQTALTESNPVFPLFKVTHVGALIVSSNLTSDDEAQVHKEGETKKVQSAVLTVDSLEPQMIYKAQVIAERMKRLNVKYDEIHAIIVAELTQMIVNKAVDLALLEGDGTNGFISIVNDKRASHVKEITDTAKLADAVEEAVSFTRKAGGTINLIVTDVQRKALLDELRAAQPTVRIKNNDKEIADEVGVNNIVVYTGKKAIKPIILVQDAFHVDMDDMTRVEAFKWETNENAILMETLSAGHVEKPYGAAFITLKTTP